MVDPWPLPPKPPFCTAYPLSFSDRDDPTRMTFRHPHNHPWSFTTDVLLVRQLLARDSSAHEHAWDRCCRCILIPRGVHLSANIVPEIEVPHGHSAPYYNPQTGVEAPFFTMGPFIQHRHSISWRTWGFRSLYGYGDLRFEKHWVIGALSRECMRSPHSIICLQGRGSPVRQEVR